ncbi:MAG: restriction endonuclease subunit S [Ruminococcus sp.]|nr:restriction endonuclease subunit S [Ruminococcus sp.]
MNADYNINDNLQQQLKLLYDYWFTQFDFPDENGKPYRSSGGKMVWNETIKQNLPLGWSCSKMETAVENVRTGLNPRDNFKLGGGSIKYITVKNLRPDGVLDFSNCDTIDEEARQIVHRRSDVSVGDILFASIAPLGRCYLVQEPTQDWDINESVFSIRYNKEIVTPEYLYMYLQSEAFVKASTACSTGSIFKGIRINSLMDSNIFIPPIDIIELFSKEVRPLFTMQNKLNKEINSLVQLRDWLLPMLMNGQATISD